MPESLLRPQPYLKKALAHGFSCEFCKIFENNFFTKNLWMSVSILQQLLALQFAVEYNWKLLSNEQLLVVKKYSFIYINDFTDLDFFYRYCFHFL